MPVPSRVVRALLACALFATAVRAAASERIVVLELTGASVGDDMRRAITDRARAAALEPARRSGFEVMTRESTALVIQQMGVQCLEGQCEIELARTVGASLVLTGEVRKLEDAFFADLKLHDTQRGSLLALESYRGQDPLDVLDQTPAAAARLVAAGIARAVGSEGTIAITVEDEGARVLLDGAEVGRGPMRKTVVAPVGPHRVVVDLEGHATWESSIDVGPRSTTHVAPRLVRLSQQGARRRVTYVEAAAAAGAQLESLDAMGPGTGLGFAARVGRRLGRSWAAELVVTRMVNDRRDMTQASISAGLAAAWSPLGGRWIWIAAEGGLDHTDLDAAPDAAGAAVSWYGSGEVRLELPLSDALSFALRTGVMALKSDWEQDMGRLPEIAPEFDVKIASSYTAWYLRAGFRFAF